MYGISKREIINELLSSSTIQLLSAGMDDT